MKIIKRIYRKGWNNPVIVITEEKSGYMIHALAGGNGYFAEGCYTDLNECIKVSEEKASKY